nr:hypothetical protein [Sinorhizobium meliloti]
MFDQTLRDRGRKATGKICRGPDDAVGDVGADTDCHHVFGNRIPKSDTRIELTFHDIGQPVIHHQLDLDTGVVTKEAWKYGAEDRID